MIQTARVVVSKYIFLLVAVSMAVSLTLTLSNEIFCSSIASSHIDIEVQAKFTQTLVLMAAL